MNLIICCTPLQVLIAEKIIAMHPEKAFFGVMLHTVENQKFDYYKQRLQAKTAGFFSLLQKKDRVTLFKQLCYLKRVFSGKQFEQVFVANFTELHIQVLLSSIQFEQLNTFDDGTVNIVKHSPFLNADPKTLMRSAINMLFGNKYPSQVLRQLSQCHYTIYHGFPNIIEKTVNVPLMEHQQVEQSHRPPINILLGQPVYPEQDKNIALAEKVIKQFDIQYYLPHPREKYQVEGVEYIHTPLIFEDYIIQQVVNQPYRVYTYFSSAILNIMGKSPNIEVIALKVETEQPDFIACYDLFEQVGIQVIDIRD